MCRCAQLRSRVLHHPPHVARPVREMEGVRRAEHVVHPRLVEPADDLHGVVVGLGEVVRVRLEVEADPVPLEVGDQLLHRRVERVLRGPGPVRVARQLGVDDRALEVRGDLQQPPPVPHVGAALLLVRRRPVVHRDQRRGSSRRSPPSPSSSRRSARRRPSGSGARRTSRPAGRARRTRTRGRRSCAAGRPPTSRRGTCACRARSSPWSVRPGRPAAVVSRYSSGCSRSDTSTRSPLSMASRPASQTTVAA